VGYLWRAGQHASNTCAPWPLRHRSSSPPVPGRWLWWNVPWGGSWGCWQKLMLVRGLMTGCSRVPLTLLKASSIPAFPLPQLCSPLAAGRSGVSPPLILWSWVCVPIFFGRLVPAVDPDSHVSSLRRRRAWWWCSWSPLHVLSATWGSMLSPVFFFAGGMGGWVSSSPRCLRLSAPHISFYCFSTHLSSSSSVAGCVGRGEWGCG
jgi:hypothetical protein